MGLTFPGWHMIPVLVLPIKSLADFPQLVAINSSSILDGNLKTRYSSS